MTDRVLIPYASRTGTRRNLRALRDAGWRLLISAAACLRSEGFPYALNGAWSAYSQGTPFDFKKFERALAKVGDGADWTVLPDIVMGGERSLELSLKWMRRVLDNCQRALLAVQNGMEPEHVREFVGPRVGIFIGGDTAWKLETLAAWCELGRTTGAWVHVGRVNSRRRILMCSRAGATSFDGTSASRFAKTTPKLDLARRQLGLFHT